MALSASDKLVLIRVKIERAKKHLSDLEEIITPYRGMRKRESILNEDRRSGEPPFKFYDLPVIPFEALACAGDVIQNLRSALDHLAFQLFTVGSPGQAPSRRFGFPICSSFGAYEADKGTKVEGMREDAKKAIDRLKPYKGGNSRLWMLHELNNIDKHKFLLTQGEDVLCDANFLEAPNPDHPYYWLKSGDPNFSGIFDDDPHDNLQLSTQQVLDNAGVSRVNAMLPTLHHLVEVIDAIAIGFLPCLQ
jgi:hypothetical protein